MSILDALLGRLGFVRLDQYGLVRSPDGRIVMLNRRVLDDGMGGRIVGWRSEDPAPTVLEPMDLVPRTAVKQVEAARASIAMAAQQVPAAVTAAVMAKKPERPATQQSDEDEWEWQLALARARAAAEEAEEAAASAALKKDLPQLISVSDSEPVLAVAKLTPARAAAAPPPPPPPAKVTPLPRTSEPAAIAPIERARIARGSAPPSSRVMSPPKTPSYARPPKKPEKEPVRVAERPLPLPAPEDTTRTRPAPPALPTRPAAIAAAAASTKAATARLDSEITKTDLRPPLPRYSARFR